MHATILYPTENETKGGSVVLTMLRWQMVVASAIYREDMAGRIINRVLLEKEFEESGIMERGSITKVLDRLMDEGLVRAEWKILDGKHTRAFYIPKESKNYVAAISAHTKIPKRV